jgi:hypothetical protein
MAPYLQVIEAYAAAAQAKEVNGVEVVLDGMYAGYGDAPRALATPRRGDAGTCVTGTKVQILTKVLQGCLRRDDAGTQFACVTGTKVRLLTKMLQRCHPPPTRIWSNSKRMC